MSLQIQISRINILANNVDDRDTKLLMINTMTGNDIKLYPNKE